MLGFVLACLGKQRSAGGGGGGYVLTDLNLSGITATVVPLRVTLVGSGDTTGATFDVYYKAPGAGSAYVLQEANVPYANFPYDIETGRIYDKFGVLRTFGARVIAGGTAEAATVTKTRDSTVEEDV